MFGVVPSPESNARVIGNMYRTEFRRTENGYVGTTYNMGVPIGNMLLKGQPRRR